VDGHYENTRPEVFVLAFLHGHPRLSHGIADPVIVYADAYHTPCYLERGVEDVFNKVKFRVHFHIFALFCVSRFCWCGVEMVSYISKLISTH